MDLTFKVDRRTWLRGHNTECSMLLDQQGRRCCLGFLAQACQIPDWKLRNTTYLHNIAGSEPIPPFLLVAPKNANYSSYSLEESLKENVNHYSYSLEQIISSINDNKVLSDQDREQQLTQLFGEYGITVIFEN